MSKSDVTIADITAYLERRGWCQRGTDSDGSRLWEAPPVAVSCPGDTPPIGPILLSVPDPTAPSTRTAHDLVSAVLADLASLLDCSRSALAAEVLDPAIAGHAELPLTGSQLELIERAVADGLDFQNAALAVLTGSNLDIPGPRPSEILAEGIDGPRASAVRGLAALAMYRAVTGTPMPQPYPDEPPAPASDPRGYLEQLWERLLHDLGYTAALHGLSFAALAQGAIERWGETVHLETAASIEGTEPEPRQPIQVPDREIVFPARLVWRVPGVERASRSAVWERRSRDPRMHGLVADLAAQIAAWPLGAQDAVFAALTEFEYWTIHWMLYTATPGDSGLVMPEWDQASGGFLTDDEPELRAALALHGETILAEAGAFTATNARLVAEHAVRGHVLAAAEGITDTDVLCRKLIDSGYLVTNAAGEQPVSIDWQQGAVNINGDGADGYSHTAPVLTSLVEAQHQSSTLLHDTALAHRAAFLTVSRARRR
jgi:hypothetical protein